VLEAARTAARPGNADTAPRHLTTTKSTPVSQDILKAFMAHVNAQPTLQRQIEAAAGQYQGEAMVDALLQIAHGAGFRLTAQDLAALPAARQAGGEELDPAQLDAVAGGIFSLAWFAAPLNKPSGPYTISINWTPLVPNFNTTPKDAS